MAMVAPGGWGVVPITVERGCQTLQLYRISQSGRFVCECRTPEEAAVAGVPVDRLIEEDDRKAGIRQPRD